MKPSIRTLLIALGLGFSVDLLFYGKMVGASLLLFTLLFVAALFIVGRTQKVSFVSQNRWLLLPLLFFAAMAAGRANPFVTGLNVLAVMGLLIYLVVFYASGHISKLGVAAAALLPGYAVMKSLTLTGPLITDQADLPALRRHGRSWLVPLARGLLLAIPVVALFGLLLASADLVFADRLSNIFNLEHLPEYIRRFWRFIRIMLVAWLCAGALTLSMDRNNAADFLKERLDTGRRLFSLGFIEATTILLPVNLLFLTFVAFQLRYLFGGRDNVHLAGFTYAEYARRGFFELVFVALLSLALILVLDRTTRRQTERQSKIFRGLSTTIVILVLVILVSAFQRLRLYEAAYGYTETRLYVYVFMSWLAILLAWFLVTLWAHPERLAIGVIVACIGFLATLNLMNPDAFIVRQNLVRYRATGDVDTGDLDVAYLATLSADAVPGLIRALDDVEGDDRLLFSPQCGTFRELQHSSACQVTLEVAIKENLAGRLEAMNEDPSWRRWQSFHLARTNAYMLLSQQ